MNDQDLQFAQTVAAEEEWHEHNRKLLNEIGMVTHGIKVEGDAWLKQYNHFEQIYWGEVK